MEIIVNGESKTVPENCSAQQLLELLEITQGRIAMEVNREIIPRSTYNEFQFKPGDQVEVVHAVGGGQIDSL
jgi:thiamine biosynthesis protein ThiS